MGRSFVSSLKEKELKFVYKPLGFCGLLEMQDSLLKSPITARGRKTHPGTSRQPERSLDLASRAWMLPGSKSERNSFLIQVNSSYPSQLLRVGEVFSTTL
jgi:hypothetical protein